MGSTTAATYKNTKRTLDLYTNNSQKNKVKPVYYHYLQWEDYQAGMYKKAISNTEALIMYSIALFLDTHKLKATMQRVVNEWPIATSHNFSKGTLNRRSWLGQAACCIDHGIPEIINRNAWNSLTEEQMRTANRIADEVIADWETTQTRDEKVFRIQCFRSGTVQGVLDLR